MDQELYPKFMSELKTQFDNCIEQLHRLDKVVELAQLQTSNNLEKIVQIIQEDPKQSHSIIKNLPESNPISSEGFVEPSIITDNKLNKSETEKHTIEVMMEIDFEDGDDNNEKQVDLKTLHSGEDTKILDNAESSQNLPNTSAELKESTSLVLNNPYSSNQVLNDSTIDVSENISELNDKNSENYWSSDLSELSDGEINDDD
ncbi:hypothetical protein AYI70_g7300 [Smittium culicis]|uniref:Uncharacterized protein n=1 Tax=Smittium culicis TaxID=133412 RepID=A0A1R1XEF2_9FUNG|nr:hypothetical protein AYI70_g11484 [Smittium culicis]OMJ13011.1 hypothetical protein AYI70_g8770 [Smittium culicis]OMJ15395.1 hypothetical protein AYI70_g7300 [Smittium culicis]